MGGSCSFQRKDVVTPAAANKKGRDQNGTNGSPVVISGSGKIEHETSSTRRKRVWVLGQTVDIKELYDFGKILGKGQFGTTRLATEVETGKQFACKSICKRKLTSEGDIEDVRREVQIMYHLSPCPNVVRLRAAFEDRQFVHLVMDLCSGGELFDRIVKRGCYTEKEASAAFHTMASVIAHCHRMGVIHRDIKPENFLLADKSDDACLLATDFGLSVFFKDGEVFDDIVGSAYYVAPEVLRRHYGKEADVWSLGILLYILLSGVPPFNGETDEDTFEEVLQGRLDFESDPWPKISAPAKDCVKRMLERDPRRRASAEQILQHPWVQPNGVAPAVQMQKGVLTRMRSFAAITKLKKEALKAIAAYLNEDEIADLRARFAAIDKKQTGTITVEDLHTSLLRVGTRIPQAELNAVLQDVKSIGSGIIDYEEFLSATVYQSKLEQEENLFVTLRRLDKDGTGYIKREAMMEALMAGRTHGLQTVSEIEGLLATVGKNDSGSLDYEEFCDKMRLRKGAVVTATKSLKKGLAFSQKSQLKLSGKNWDFTDFD